VPDDLVERLYAAPPEGFVAARAAAVAAARQAGDRDTAKRFGALKKPTVAAWLVNLLALRRPELLDELVELAAALRSAQRNLKGDQLRELSTERRRAVSALVAEARRLAVEADPSVSAGKLPLAEVENTLTAALADTDIAEQIRSGRLIRAVSYAGFGEVPRPRLRLVGDDEDIGVPPTRSSGGTAERRTAAGPGAADGPEAQSGGDRDARAAEDGARELAARAARRRDLARELAVARTAETRARKQLDRAETAERDAARAVAAIEAELADLERRREAAQADASGRKLARRAAERDAAVARRRVGDVQAALESLDEDGEGTS
jgi:hypothetical protein